MIKNVALFFLFHLILFSKNTVSIDTVFFYPTSFSIDEAKTESLNRCRKIAVEKTVPKKTIIAENAILEKMESDGEYHENAAFTSFHSSTSLGYITKETIELALPESFVENGFNYHISYKATVEVPKGERDSGLKINFYPKSRSVNDGEELVLFLNPSMNGFLYIFHFMPDQSVELMFPNQYLFDNALEKKSVFQFPSDDQIKIRLKALPHRKITTETFYAVFCKKEIPELNKIIQLNEHKGRTSAGDGSFEKFQSILAEIPLYQRIEAALQVLVLSK